MPLFSMTLVPEGVPVWDKAGKMTALYARYRDRLARDGVEAGILVQASLGHGYSITANPFTRYVNLYDGAEENVCCPLDDAFIAHFCDVLRTLARGRPRAIMLDDDFRLMMRPGRGCTCHLHMEEFNRRAGTAMSREELREYIREHGDKDRLTRLYADTQRDALVRAATAFRAAIDEIDPTIQGINCTSGSLCESVTYTNKIFAGKGNPTMVRVPNGCYAPITTRGFSEGMRAAAMLCQKGFGALLGVEASDWDLSTISSETFDGKLYQCCTHQKNAKKLTVTDPHTQVLSHNFLRGDGKSKLLAPAVTVLPREGGKITVTFCGTPNANFNYMEGFAFLNETRKQQLVSLLQRAGALPVYCEGDDEICLRAGYLADGTLLVAVFALGVDPIDELRLCLTSVPTQITALTPSGEEEALSFSCDGNLCTVHRRVETMDPLILLLK